MSLAGLLLYTTGALAIIVSPGPDFLYVITRGIAQGRKAGIFSALGISIGLMVHTALAAVGLSALLQTSGLAFQTVKLTGAAYLVYLGIKMITARKTLIDSATGKVESTNVTAVFRQGVITNVFNPKAVITFMAFIPQFVNPTDSSATLQIVILGGVIAFLAIVWFGIIGYFAGALGSWLAGKRSVQHLIQRMSGAVLVALGLRLAFARRQ
jgi:RhtB (resistance to homoserine/threonine) family protein